MKNKIIFRGVIAGIAVVVISTFFYIYNNYILNKSLYNLKLSLQEINQSENINDAKGIKQLLEEVFLMEAAREKIDPATLVKVELSSQRMGEITADKDLEEIKYYLKEIIEQKEQKQNPFIVAVDNFLVGTFGKKKLNSKKSIVKDIKKMTKEIKRLKGAQLQDKGVELAKKYISLGDWDKALTFLKQAVAVSPESKQGQMAKMYMAIVYKQKGQWDQAESLFKEIKDKLPKDLAAFSGYQQGDSLYRSGNLPEALAVFEETFDENALMESAQLAQLRAGYIYLYNIGDGRGANKAFMKLNSRVRGNRFNRLVDELKLPLAAEKEMQAGFIFLEEGYQLSGEGKAIEAQIKYRQALKKFEEARSLCPVFRNSQVVQSIADKYRQTGFDLLEQGFYFSQDLKEKEAVDKYLESLEQFKKATEFYSKDPLSFSGKGLAMYFLGEDIKAIEDGRRAKELAPKNVIALINAGYVYYRLGMLSEAINEYSLAASIMPESALIQYNLGTLYIKTDQINKAANYFRQVIKLKPEHPFAHNNIGYIYWLKGSYREAKNHFETAIGLKPDYVDPHYNLGVVFFLLKQYEEAKEEFLKVNELVPRYRGTEVYLKEIDKKMPSWN